MACRHSLSVRPLSLDKRSFALPQVEGALDGDWHSVGSSTPLRNCFCRRNSVTRLHSQRFSAVAAHSQGQFMAAVFAHWLPLGSERRHDLCASQRRDQHFALVPQPAKADRPRVRLSAFRGWIEDSGEEETSSSSGGSRPEDSAQQARTANDSSESQLYQLPNGWADPTPENLLALGLTAVLLLALLNIGWQILAVAVKVTVAGLKYTFVAGLLIAAVILFL